MGLSSARTHSLQTPSPPPFWPPPPNTQQLQFRSLPKIELLFPFSFTLLSSSFTLYLCLLHSPVYIYTHTRTYTLAVSTSFQLNFFPPFLSPLLDEWLIFSWRRLSLWPIFLFFYFHTYSSCWVFTDLWRLPTISTFATWVVGCTDGQTDGWIHGRFTFTASNWLTNPIRIAVVLVVVL